MCWSLAVSRVPTDWPVEQWRFKLWVPIKAVVETPHVRATQSVDPMAVTYMVTTLFWLLIALRFVNPTQLVTRVKKEPKK